MRILSSIMDDLFEDERQFKAQILFNQIAAVLTKILQKYCSWNIFIENCMLLFFIRYVRYAKYGFLPQQIIRIYRVPKQGNCITEY
jgi:hypothetical protein